jgi:hypothetical protein
VHGRELLPDAVVAMFEHGDGLVESGRGVGQGICHHVLSWNFFVG